ncbi:MAG: hypothetical protein HWE10_06495 [Gammaproteobacteria bacterium]|nr:hypothetical protein [Gammaproteobacteria bacterium]
MFKKTLSLILALTISACASNVQTPILVAPAVSMTKELIEVEKVEVIDLRAKAPLAFINGSPMPVSNNLLENLEMWLGKSIDTNPLGDKTLTVNLLSYASYVKQETVTFNIESVLEWQVKVESEGSTWTKSFQSTINEEGPLQADNSIIEKHLNKLAENLLKRTLSDAELEEVTGSKVD